MKLQKTPLYLTILVSLYFISSHLGFSKTEQITVFKSGSEGYHTFRIPSIIKAPNGDLLAICEGRKNSRSDRGDIDILMRRSSDEGRSWSDIQVIWDDGENTCGNPCAVVDEETKTIWLLLTHNIGSDMEKNINAGTSKGSRTVWVCSSKDNGKTWSTPQEITKDTKAANWRWYATGPGVGIQIKQGPHAGRLVIPCDHSFPVNEGNSTEYGSHVIYSDDHGNTWNLGGVIQPKVNECQLVELFDDKGTLLIDMRSYEKLACRAQSLSRDGGISWSPKKNAKALIEPVCQASILRWERGVKDNKGYLIFSNPANKKKRRNMTVRISDDNGISWSRSLRLTSNPSAYSCLVALDENNAACFYETGEKLAYERLVFARFSEKDFKGKE